MRPEPGVSFPVVLERVVDGDTIVVRGKKTNLVWRVRLKDCWAPNRTTQAGAVAKKFAERTLQNTDPTELLLQIIFDEDLDNLADLFSFERIVGVLWVAEDRDLNSLLVRKGLASTTRNGELGT